MRRLSELNLILAILLMLFVLVVGPTLFLLRALVQNFGLYLDHFFIRSFTLYAYEPRAWMADWTLFYWAWWIAWSPFVGMFIARISRGRTIREFVVGVLFVPTGFTFLWMTVFGDTAIALDLGWAAGGIAEAVQADLSTALFKFFEYLPGTSITSTLAILLVAVFFVTSADSGSLVIGTLTAGGAEETPRWQRMFWCVLLGVTAALLLLAGGLGALQAATLMAALPFCFIMFFLIAGLIRQTKADLEGSAISRRFREWANASSGCSFQRRRRALAARSPAMAYRPSIPCVMPCWRKAGQSVGSRRARGWRRSPLSSRPIASSSIVYTLDPTHFPHLRRWMHRKCGGILPGRWQPRSKAIRGPAI